MEDLRVEKIAEQAIKDGVKSVVVLVGEAPKQHNNNCIDILGNIDAPSRFIKVRGKDFETSDRHCLVSEEKGKIELIINPQSSVDKHVITGKIKKSHKFVGLGINNSNQSYSPDTLHRKLKLMRSAFVNPSDHTDICKALKNLEAKINRDVEDKDDEKGNVSLAFKQTVESNIPKEFEISIPVIEGEPPVSMVISINLKASGTSTIQCFLESIDAADIIEATFKKRIEQEVALIQDWSVVITY